MITAIVPVKDENPDWVQNVVSTANHEVYEVLVVVPPGDPANPVGARVIEQYGRFKAAALNTALQHVATDHYVVVDADVDLQPGQIAALHEELERGADVIGVATVSQKTPFGMLFPAYGWFHAAKTDVVRDAGGYVDHVVEDMKTMQRLIKRGVRIHEAPFVVRLRRGTRNISKLVDAGLWASYMA